MAKEQEPVIADVNILVKGYEFGPAIPKLVVRLDKPVSKVSAKDLRVETAGVKRAVSKVYLADETGKKVTKGASQYVSIQLPISYHVKEPSKNPLPFVYNLAVLHNQWVDHYPVTVKGLTVTSENQTVKLNSESDAIKKRLSPDTELFTNKGSHSGLYTNLLTKASEKVTLHYAAYEPEYLKASKAKNPLLIWLHGQGEGGTDTDITLLGNEVVALAKNKIQNHFTTGKDKGAYVLAVQTETYWMDEGDGTNGSGAGVSRYTEALMDTIKNYVASNPDVDPSRIYLTGGSNGGYMTVNMALHYPDYFAALVPQATAYSYYQYERNADGTYKKVASDKDLSGKAPVITDKVWFDKDKIDTLKDIPMWFIHAKDDKIVTPKHYALPIYKALIDSGADNKWFSYYQTVKGSDIHDTTYNGHWSWIYYFNDQVSGVQDIKAIQKASDLSGFKANDKDLGGKSKAKVGSKTYHNLFDWLNDQKK